MKLLPKPKIKFERIEHTSVMVRVDWLKRIDKYIDGHLHLSVPKLFAAMVEAKAIPRDAKFWEWSEVLRLRLRAKRKKQLSAQINTIAEMKRDPLALSRFFTAKSQNGSAVIR